MIALIKGLLCRMRHKDWHARGLTRQEYCVKCGHWWSEI